jgi:hypothetical protein
MSELNLTAARRTGHWLFLEAPLRAQCSELPALTKAELVTGAGQKFHDNRAQDNSETLGKRLIMTASTISPTTSEITPLCGKKAGMILSRPRENQFR